MSGSSGSGKTTRLLDCLQLKDVICNAKFYKKCYFCSTWQGIYDEMKLQKLLIISSKVYLIKKAWCQWLTTIHISVSLLHFPITNCLCLMIFLCDIVSRQDDLMQNLFTVYFKTKSKRCYVNQMLLQPGDYKLNVLCENLHYLFLF